MNFSNTITEEVFNDYIGNQSLTLCNEPIELSLKSIEEKVFDHFIGYAGHENEFFENKYKIINFIENCMAKESQLLLDYFEDKELEDLNQVHWFEVFSAIGSKTILNDVFDSMFGYVPKDTEESEEAV